MDKLSFPSARPVELSAKQVLFENQFVRFYSVSAKFPAFSKNYYVSDYGRRVGVLIMRDESLFLVRQYRFILNDISWEIPGGNVEPGETFEEAARREMLEEAGLVCGGLQPLFRYQPGVDCLSNETRLFFTTAAKEASLAPSSEIVDRSWIPMDESLRMVFDGRIVDILTVTALFSYALLHPAGRR